MHVIDPTKREMAVAAALGKLSNLAMLPEIAVRVIRLAEDPNVTMSQMADVISTSPELCVRILRVVNSAFYGIQGEVRTIQRATTLMGLESVKNVTIAASLTRLFHGRPLSPTFSPRDLWTHSLAVAAATRLIAMRAKSGVVEEAFLAGMVHDVGLIAELQLDRQKLATVLARMEDDEAADLLAVEEAAFGANHQDFGAGLLKAWKLPRIFSLAAGWHHRPFELPVSDRALPVMVHVGDRLVAACAPGLQLDDPSTEISEAALDSVRLTRAQMEDVLVCLPQALEEIKSALG